MKYEDFKFLEEKKKEIDKVRDNKNLSKFRKVEYLYELGLSRSMIKDVLEISYNMVYNYIVKLELKKELEELKELKELSEKKEKKK